MNRKIVYSGDGTPTIYVEEIDQHYHSLFGARTESEHIFIHTGLDAMKKKDVHLLEVGFGTGLNAYLSLMYKKPGVSIRYFSIEKYPLIRNEWEALNYFPSDDQYAKTWKNIHTCEWEKWNLIVEGFELFKTMCDFNQCDLPDGQDLIYFDAFSPDVQPELWSIGTFNKLYSCMNTGGIMVTYSVKGIVKQRLKDAGFQIEKLPGPPGKRQILRAIK